MNWDRILYPLDLVGCNLLGRRFVGAFSVDGVLNVGRDLKKQGFGVTYNLLGEHVVSQETVELAVRTTKELLSKMNPDNSGNVSCKPTLYGLCLSKDKFKEMLGGLINDALNRGIEIEIDAENYAYIEDTFDVFSSFASQESYSNTVRQAVQAHLKNITYLMDKYKLWDKNLRIVKGSGVYDEALEIVENRDDKTRERYFEILRRNIETGRMPYTATIRDRDLAESIIKITGYGEYHFEFQMLYGLLGQKLGQDLLLRGYPVRIYVPCTDYWCHDEWKAYGLRRAKMMRNLMLKSFKDSIKLG